MDTSKPPAFTDEIKTLYPEPLFILQNLIIVLGLLIIPGFFLLMATDINGGLSSLIPFLLGVSSLFLPIRIIYLLVLFPWKVSLYPDRISLYYPLQFKKRIIFRNQISEFSIHKSEMFNSIGCNSIIIRLEDQRILEIDSNMFWNGDQIITALRSAEILQGKQKNRITLWGRKYK